MKKIIITLLFVSATVTGFAQFNNEKFKQNETKRADKYFERAFYADAIPLYEELAKRNRSFKTVGNLADSYYNLGSYKSAARWYRYLVKNYESKLEESHKFKYIQTLKAIGDYKGAQEVQRRFAEKSGGTDAVAALEKEFTYLENVEALGNRFSLESLRINTAGSEFGVSTYNDQLVYAAPKKEFNLLDVVYRWTGEAYLDLYAAPVDKLKFGDSVAVAFPKEINTKMHEANAVFTKDGNTMYFTRNNYSKGKRTTDGKKVTHLSIYRAEKVDGTWTNITSLPFNGEDYSTEHPALSPDEKTLYFASDMPGTLGSFDIFSVEIKADGNFGQPVNLGSLVNTARREQFPFMTQEGKLYFSSNGHPGFGSLDVFVTEKKGTSFAKPDNVGLPVNSGFDDFAFTIDPKTKKGYFSSNRPTGMGGDDIYAHEELKPLVIEDCGQSVTGIITDAETKAPIGNVEIKVLHTENNDLELASLLTNAKGEFTLPVGCEMTLKVDASKLGYQPNQKMVILRKERGKDNDASMELVSLESIRKKEEAKRVAEMEAKERAEKQRQEAEAKSKADRVANIIKKEKDIVQKNDKLVINVEQIRFDYNLWYVRRDSKKIMRNVISLMKKYPDMVVEIGTHTDIRGNEKYNQNLSEKRANAVREYIMSQDIEPDRIIAVGYGESNPIQYCETEDSCNEEEHEINRRCEFVIKSIE